MTEAIEEIEFLARSKHRVRILDLLCENGTLEKHVLGEKLDASRTTVGRNLTALERQGWIRRTNSHCAITRRGELVAENFAEVVEAVELADDLDSFLRWIPDGSLDLDLGVLAEAEIALPNSRDSRAMLNRHTKLLEGMEQARGLLPFISLHSSETVEKRMVRSNAQAEIVVGPDVANLYRSVPEYTEIMEKILTTGRFEIYVHEGSIPYGLAAVDDTVQVVATEDDKPRAVLETDANEAREWATETYERYKRQSNELLLRA